MAQPLAHLVNAGSDIDSSAEAVIRTHENTAITTNATALTGDEEADIVTVANALRGRGVRRPLDLLLHYYHDPIKTASFDEAWAISVAGATRR